MQIAVATTDGEHINEHFGRVDRWFIYERTEGRLTLLAVRAVQPLSTGDPGHGYDPARMAATLAALKGCSRVYCSRIGDRPKEELHKRGIEPMVASGPIAALVA